MNDQKNRKNNARPAGETHNNNYGGFGAYRFTCVGMKILRVQNGNVSFTIEKVTFLRPKNMVESRGPQQ